MALPPEPDQGISDEVYGVFSRDQRNQYLEIWASIIQIQKLDGTDPNVQKQIAGVVTDCIDRGLHAQARTWFGPDENIEPIFQTGLQLREKALERVRTLVESDPARYFVTYDEEKQLERMTALSPDFQNVDTALANISKRRQAVAQLHEELFVGSQLALQAQALLSNMEVNVAPQDAEGLTLTKRTMLFTNLLTNMALRKPTSLEILPEDIAMLADIWRNDDARARGKSEVLNKIRTLAESLGIDQDAITRYTSHVLADVSLFLDRPEIGLTQIREENIFAISPDDMQLSLAEFVRNHPPIIITQEDSDNSRTAVSRVATLQHDLKTHISDTKRAYQNYVRTVYNPFLDGLTPVDLGTLYLARQNGATKGIEFRDLEEEIPLATYIQTLRMLGAQDIRVEPAGQPFTEFSQNALSTQRAYDQVMQVVVAHILKRQFKHGENFQQIIQTLPSDALSKYLEAEDIDVLDQNELDTLFAIDNQTWYDIAIISHVSATNFGGKAELVSSSSGGIGSLHPYFEKMPSEKQEAIANLLLHVISF